MPADQSHIPMGRRRNHEGERLAPDDRNKSLERAIDRDAQREAEAALGFGASGIEDRAENQEVVEGDR